MYLSVAILLFKCTNNQRITTENRLYSFCMHFAVLCHWFQLKLSFLITIRKVNSNIFWPFSQTYKKINTCMFLQIWSIYSSISYTFLLSYATMLKLDDMLAIHLIHILYLYCFSIKCNNGTETLFWEGWVYEWRETHHWHVFSHPF